MQKRYDPVAIDQVVSSARRREMSQRKATQKFRALKSTVRDRTSISGKTKHSRQGPGYLHSLKEEGTLVNYMVYISNQGLFTNSPSDSMYCTRNVSKFETSFINWT